MILVLAADHGFRAAFTVEREEQVLPRLRETFAGRLPKESQVIAKRLFDADCADRIKRLAAGEPLPILRKAA